MDKNKRDGRISLYIKERANELVSATVLALHTLTKYSGQTRCFESSVGRVGVVGYSVRVSNNKSLVLFHFNS